MLSYLGYNFFSEHVHGFGFRFLMQVPFDTRAFNLVYQGCRMVEMSCAEHDQYAAGSQFITHTVGRLLCNLDLPSFVLQGKLESVPCVFFVI